MNATTVLVILLFLGWLFVPREDNKSLRTVSHDLLLDDPVTFPLVKQYLFRDLSSNYSVHDNHATA